MAFYICIFSLILLIVSELFSKKPPPPFRILFYGSCLQSSQSF